MQLRPKLSSYSPANTSLLVSEGRLIELVRVEREALLTRLLLVDASQGLLWLACHDSVFVEPWLQANSSFGSIVARPAPWTGLQDLERSDQLLA